MAFANGSYASIWETRPATFKDKDGNVRQMNATDVRLSTSRKNKTSGEYESDFSGFVRFIGNAHTDITNAKLKNNPQGVKEPIARIKLGEISATKTYSYATQKEYTAFQCYSFNFEEMKPRTERPLAVNDRDNSFTYVPEGISEELPFT